MTAPTPLAAAAAIAGRLRVERSADPDLYDGDAGVAWFLAHHGRVADDASSRSVAATIARDALSVMVSRLGGSDAGERHQARTGLHTGDLGVVWAASEVARLVDDSALAALADRAATLARHALAAPSTGGWDVMAGAAGTLLAMLALAEVPADADEAARRKETAGRLAQALASGAREEAVGLAWPSPVEPGGTPVSLVGLAHGASGPALALLEAAAVAPHAAAGELRAVAAEAFLFERSRFDRAWNGWRDPDGRSPQPPATSWCRGAAGIALVRLRALQLGGLDAGIDRLVEADAGAALAALHAAAAGAIAGGPWASSWEQANASVCHGLGGLADTLLYAAAVLDVDEHRQAAERVIAHLIAAADEEGDWPCGTIDRLPSPGLATGLAGIGVVLLRAHAPREVPPVGLLGYSTSDSGTVEPPSS